MNKYTPLNNFDIFKSLNIVDENGCQLSEKNLNPCLGYQIVNIKTGQLLPHTENFEVMGIHYATIKLNNLIKDYNEMSIDFPFNDYTLEPIYFSELEENAGFLLQYTELDQELMDIFN